MRLPSNRHTQHTFSQVPKAEIRRSIFNRGHSHKTTWGISNAANYLIPIYVDEALPGDTFVMKLNAFCRLIPTIAPLMDNLYLDFFFFAVPNRLLWSNWKKFNGEQDNPGDSTSYVNPVVTTPAGGYLQTSMADHFGLPIGINGMPNVNALPFRAYNLIWKEWFRDQNLQNSPTINTGDGPDTFGSNYPLQPRGKRHDYFTSCLPLPQKAPAVNLPLPSAGSLTFTNNNSPSQVYKYNSGGLNTVTDTPLYTALSSGANMAIGSAGTQLGQLDITGHTTVNASAWATINQLRTSFQLQRLYERDNRGGTRYTEIIRSHFGVTSPDARQQRPEYLGGGTVPVILNPVPQTSATSGSNAQGNLAAYGTAAAPGNIGFTYSSTEHCILMGLVCARADLNYQQGIDRMWSRSTRFDYFWPALAHIGEQAVLNQEIYAQGNASDAQTFGYQERYAEYRYKPSKITNEFNSNAATPLDFWHLAEKYTSLPTLGSTWISAGPPLSRAVAVTTTDPLLLDCYFDLKCARPMPVYSVPGLVDHF